MKYDRHLLAVPVEERLALYNEAWQLRDETDYSISEIARKLDLNYNTVQNWLKKDVKPAPVWNITQVDLSPSPELAYVIGATLGDGTLLPNHGWLIQLRVKDKSFVDYFNEMVCIVLKRSEPYHMCQYDSQHYGIFHILQVHSKILCQFLMGEISGFVRHVQAYPAEFLQGLTDAEGCVCWTWTNSRLYKRIQITNSDLELIELTKLALKIIGVRYTIYNVKKGKPRMAKDGHMITPKKGTTQLTIRRKPDISTFAQLVGFRIPRKTIKLKQLLVEMRKIGHIELSTGRRIVPASVGQKISASKTGKTRPDITGENNISKRLDVRRKILESLKRRKPHNSTW